MRYIYFSFYQSMIALLVSVWHLESGAGTDRGAIVREARTATPFPYTSTCEPGNALLFSPGLCQILSCCWEGRTIAADLRFWKSFPQILAMMNLTLPASVFLPSLLTKAKHWQTYFQQIDFDYFHVIFCPKQNARGINTHFHMESNLYDSYEGPPTISYVCIVG